MKHNDKLKKRGVSYGVCPIRWYLSHGLYKQWEDLLQTPPLYDHMIHTSHHIAVAGLESFSKKKQLFRSKLGHFEILPDPKNFFSEFCQTNIFLGFAMETA